MLYLLLKKNVDPDDKELHFFIILLGCTGSDESNLCKYTAKHLYTVKPLEGYIWSALFANIKLYNLQLNW